MRIDVYDTYALSQSGKTLHFDVLLPSGARTKETALRYARIFLESIGQSSEALNLEQCSFCHSETASAMIKGELEKSGYYILQMEGCPDPH